MNKLNPSTWSKRAWIAVFVSPLALSITLTACAPAQSRVERAMDVCVEVQKEKLGVDTGLAHDLCAYDLRELGERTFIDRYVQP